MTYDPIVLFISDEQVLRTHFKEAFVQFFNLITMTFHEAGYFIDDKHKSVAVIVVDHDSSDNIQSKELLTDFKKYYPDIMRILVIAEGTRIPEKVMHDLNIYACLNKPWDQHINNSNTIVSTLCNVIAEFKSQWRLLSLGNSITHEMRNPLGQIKYYLQSMEESSRSCITQAHKPRVTTENAEVILADIEKSHIALNRGMQAIDMILEDIRRDSIDTEHFTFLSAATLVKQALQDYAHSNAVEKNHIFLDVEQDFIFKGNQTLFIFIIFNLLKNALYYLPSHPNLKVTIALSGNKQHNCITFTDTGPGIKQDQLSHIFDPFFSLGKKNVTGLGLAYCRKTMQSFGGDILCESLSDQYTRFLLCFPKYQPDEIPEVSLTTFNGSIRRNIQILLVEDDYYMRGIIKKIFNKNKIQLSEAEHGQQALEILENSQCDLIFMDINMPIMDGWETTRRIRNSNKNYKHIPIIGLSSYGGHNQVAEAQKRGMNDYLQKPATWKMLREQIEQWLPEQQQGKAEENKRGRNHR